VAVNDYKKLNENVTLIGNSLLTTQLETNMKAYYDWGLLEVGGFSNVTNASSGAYGGGYARLRAVDDPSFTNGQVWESARKDWVWESGLDFSTSPIDISGVYIGTGFYESGDATHAHHYNYPLGRVVFDTAIANTSVVELNYSYRNIQTYVADQAGWFDELQYNSYRIDDTTFHNIGSGNWQVLSANRVQMPAVVIEATSRRSFKPYEMGTVGSYVYQDILFHILSESRWWRNQLVDIISLDKDRTIWLYDNNSIEAITGYPLDHRGMRVGGSALMYKDLVDDHRYKKARFFNMAVTEMESFSSRLHRATVRATMEIIMA